MECGLKIKKQGAHDAANDTDILDPEEEGKRWDQVVDPNILNTKLNEYLGGKALPYIERVIAAAFPGRNARVRAFANSSDLTYDRPVFSGADLELLA